jgi:hypothetical protein
VNNWFIKVVYSRFYLVLSCLFFVGPCARGPTKDKERETKNLVPDRHEGPSLPVAFDRKLVSVSERQGRRPAASPDTHFLSLPVTCPSSVAAGFLSLSCLSFVLGPSRARKTSNPKKKINLHNKLFLTVGRAPASGLPPNVKE